MKFNRIELQFIKNSKIYSLDIAATFLRHLFKILLRCFDREALVIAVFYHDRGRILQNESFSCVYFQLSFLQILKLGKILHFLLLLSPNNDKLCGGPW